MVLLMRVSFFLSFNDCFTSNSQINTLKLLVAPGSFSIFTALNESFVNIVADAL